MKCRKCDRRASINMRQHKLALCSSHFQEWIRLQTERTIKKYKMFTHSDRVLVAVSGGKDSLALWDVLHNLGYQTAGLYIHLGIAGEDNYSNQSQKLCENFAHDRGLHLHLMNIQEKLGYTVPEIAKRSPRGKTKTCAVCGMIKRHTMNEIAAQFDYDVLVTGHNLDDEVAVLMSNTLNWHIDFLRRQEPFLQAKDGLSPKAKPFCRFYEKETAAYTLLSGIEYIEDECPYSVGNPSIDFKELLNQMENKRAGTKLAFYVKFLNAKKALFLNGEDEENVDRLFLCDDCGQPTQSPGLCAFCKMVDRLKTDN